MSWRMTIGGTACRRIMAAGQWQEHCLKLCTKSTMGCTASSRRCRLSWRRSLPLSAEVRGRPFVPRAFVTNQALPHLCLGRKDGLHSDVDRAHCHRPQHVAAAGMPGPPKAHGFDCMPVSCSGQLMWLSAQAALKTSACLLRWLAILLQMASHHLLQWRRLCRM